MKTGAPGRSDGAADDGRCRGKNSGAERSSGATDELSSNALAREVLPITGFWMVTCLVLSLLVLPGGDGEGRLLTGIRGGDGSAIRARRGGTGTATAGASGWRLPAPQ